MSIRLLAKEMYRLFQESEKIKQQLETASIPDRPALEERLRRVTAEQRRIRHTLDGAIDRK